MIRRALVPAIGICAALGVGIALGGGPLSDRGDASTTASNGTRRADAVLSAQVSAGDKLAAATAATLYAHRLAGQQVAIVTMPGAPAAVVQALAGQVAAAGGVVASTTRVSASALDPDSKAMVDSLGSQLAGQTHGVVDAAQPTYVRLGQLVGSAVATTAAAGAPSADQATALATLAESRLMALSGTGSAQAGTRASVQTTAPLILLVLGDHVDPTILAGLVQGTATRAHGVVVAGSTGSGLRGDLKRLRADDLGAQSKTVATVDGDERNTGQVATVLTLAHQVTGGGGAYGASGIDGVAPLG
ncbi:copper transporter [Nocardioides sp. BP30]|uniref:copper transporter n=1 Tax=Nocardioides sp. BP30 TaxID=3036374 RepID=UPI002468A2F9|nr:copper transporter [Nocardioides sp. BP30]WGL50520.1 copper transporter [Nocardioides sp. BP30]